MMIWCYCDEANILYAIEDAPRARPYDVNMNTKDDLVDRPYISALHFLLISLHINHDSYDSRSHDSRNTDDGGEICYEVEE
jgi:hypothetical protein